MSYDAEAWDIAVNACGEMQAPEASLHCQMVQAVMVRALQRARTAGVAEGRERTFSTPVGPVAVGHALRETLQALRHPDDAAVEGVHHRDTVALRAAAIEHAGFCLLRLGEMAPACGCKRATITTPEPEHSVVCRHDCPCGQSILLPPETPEDV